MNLENFSLLDDFFDEIDNKSIFAIENWVNVNYSSSMQLIFF